MHKDQSSNNLPGFAHKSIKILRNGDRPSLTLFDETARVPYYEAKIELTKEGEAELIKHKLQLLPGMLHGGRHG